MRVIDLFSGLGGASQAFIDRGHDVIRYDIDPKFKDVPNTIIQDVRELIWNLDLSGVKIVLVGFPCNCFSVLANHITWPKGIPREQTKEMIVFVRDLKDWLEQSPVDYYIIENPMGMMRNSLALGKPSATIAYAAYGSPYLKKTDLWGRLPPFDRKLPFKWQKASRGSNAGIQSTSLSPEERSLWPYDLSLTVCLAVEGNSPQQILEVD